MEKATSVPGKVELYKVLVTGSAGFIGKATIKALKEEGYGVVHFDLQAGWDVRHPMDLASCEFDKVIHLAAVSSTPWGRSSPQSAFTTNVYGTYNVLKVAVEKGASNLVFASSYRVSNVPLDNPYVVSKFLEEALLDKVFSNPLSVSIRALRYTSVYGPEGFKRTHSLNIMNQIIKAAMDGTEVTIFGDGSQTRDFVYVDDVARANVLALTGWKAEIVDVGSGKATRVKDAVEMVEDISGRKVRVNYTGEYPSDYMMEQQANVYRCNQVIGFEPKVDLLEGIKLCTQWYSQAAST